ncbi:hypothetical protein P7K49_034164 [Saguinus oedipus]|uniref:Uncharacterized protein n=1 Tax=Saguinus oedipus TaxID=9490 RepID=A0ABQ9TTZ3_SAGOE|nr:hypothetical protein P7K49_034164 [Saguinus oedipus]
MFAYRPSGLQLRNVGRGHPKPACPSGIQVDGENSEGQTALFLSTLLGHSSAMQLLLTFGANPNHLCVDGRMPVLELFQLCGVHISALLHGGELPPMAFLGHLQARSGNSLPDSLSSMRLMQADRALRLAQIRRGPQVPALGFGQLSSLWPLGMVTGIPLADPKELLAAWGEADHTYESSSHTLMANLLWRGHLVTMWQLKSPGTQLDVLLFSTAGTCASPQPSLLLALPWKTRWPALLLPGTLYHLGLLLLMALSPSADLSGLCLLFEPVWLGSLHGVLHPRGPSEEGPQTVPGLPPGPLLLQVLEGPLFLQVRWCWQAHGGLSSYAVQLVRPGVAKVGHLEHRHSLHQCWLWPRGGPEVKAKLEAGESPALDPRVPAPYQALVRAGLGLAPADRWGSLQSHRPQQGPEGRSLELRQQFHSRQQPRAWPQPHSQGLPAVLRRAQLNGTDTPEPCTAVPLLTCGPLHPPSSSHQPRVPRLPSFDQGTSGTPGVPSLTCDP